MFKYIKFWLTVFLIFMVAGGIYCFVFLCVAWLYRQWFSIDNRNGDTSASMQPRAIQRNFSSESDDSHSTINNEINYFVPYNLHGEDASSTVINPATGLPMVGDSYAGVDVGGNSYGTNDADFNSSYDFWDDSFGSMETFDSSYDSFSSSHDSFGSSSSNGFD